jgi:uncharacterized membrane protein
MIYVLALLIGAIAGLRAMIAPTAVSWAAAQGSLALQGSWLAFLGWRFMPWIFTTLALVELVTDQLPSTPSRTVPVQFGTRIALGGLSGAAVGMPAGAPGAGCILGAIGAVIGTYGGATLRARLASTFGSDRPAALIEDAVAIGGALLVLACL